MFSPYVFSGATVGESQCFRLLRSDRASGLSHTGISPNEASVNDRLAVCVSNSKGSSVELVGCGRAQPSNKLFSNI